MDGAHRVTMGDRGHPVDVAAQDPGENPGFSFAQFRELCGNVRYRTMVLTQLLPGSVRSHKGDIAFCAQCLSQGNRGRFTCCQARGAVAGQPVFQSRHQLFGKMCHSLRSGGFLQVAQGPDRQFVV